MAKDGKHYPTKEFKNNFQSIDWSSTKEKKSGKKKGSKEKQVEGISIQWSRSS